MNDILTYRVPKWTPMIVTGAKITQDQALEVIRRTDEFFQFWGSGNDREFKRSVYLMLNRPMTPAMLLGIENPDNNDCKNLVIYNEDEYIAREKSWETAWGTIPLENLVNSWISSSYIWGPTGWCHPDGTIGFSGDLVDEPTIEKLCDEWQKIIQEFPFLEVEVQLLHNTDNGNIEPLLLLLIRNGTVEIVDGAGRDVYKEFSREFPTGISDEEKEIFLEKLWQFDFSATHAIPMEQIRKWASLKMRD